MPSFFAEITKKLAEKWLSLLVLPGLLLIGTATIATLLGQRQWADADRLVDRADRLAADLAARPAAASALLTVAVLLAAAAAGLAATSIGTLIQRWWTSRWPAWANPVMRVLLNRRRDRWNRLTDRHDRLVKELCKKGEGDSAERRELARKRNAISLTEPTLPTWIGDRIASMQALVDAEYRLDITTAWPRLWLLVSEDRRTEVRTAASAFDTSAILAGWGSLYLAVGVLWWPAAIIGGITCGVAWSRGRRGVVGYAELVESVVDLYLKSLGEQLGLIVADPAELGAAVNSRLKKGT